jgi:hypothetical protein
VLPFCSQIHNDPCSENSQLAARKILATHTPCGLCPFSNNTCNSTRAYDPRKILAVANWNDCEIPDSKARG